MTWTKVAEKGDIQSGSSKEFEVEGKKIAVFNQDGFHALDGICQHQDGSIAPKGNIVIDDGAKKALKLGKSLLAAGIKNVSGRFNKGDHIKVLDKKNNECARGLSSFSSDEVKKIMGHHSNEIQKLLGYVAKSEVIHKDDMVEV